MQDETRADLLYRALATGEPLPAESDDVELAALFELGTELQLHGATIAMIEEADARIMLASGTDIAAVTPTSKPRARVFAQSNAAPRPATPNHYDLPATLPTLPSSALVYRVRYAPITGAALKHILASFPDTRSS